MEIANTNDENSFDPTPRLKPSPIPIKFISFNWKDKKCVYCGEYYTDTILGVRHQYHYIRRQEWQQYCQKCLSHYIKNVTHINMYSDVYMDLECKEHKISRTKIPQSIQECCENCVKILCFKQIDVFIASFCKFTLDKVIESEKNCKLCGKLYQGTDIKSIKEIKLCSDCYLISSGLIESTLAAL
ncbi:uncharacterized protein OCT59_006061 [Rhizophagus irregularis]|uniref:uncharacterized protein n=1 Tax=Rhizophagus irregularis TaxID=588596 RepID=UPI000CAFE0E8|nr:hypothetical protein OCT59_006061 [Rhizophagus irregularis]